jgi:biopolymer transport protein ExbD
VLLALSGTSSGCQRPQVEWTTVTVLPDGSVSYKDQTLSQDQFASLLAKPCFLQLDGAEGMRFEDFRRVMKVTQTAGCEVVLFGEDAG